MASSWISADVFFEGTICKINSWINIGAFCEWATFIISYKMTASIFIDKPKDKTHKDNTSKIYNIN